MKSYLRNVFFRAWYSYVSKVDKHAEVLFMNYGFSRNQERINLNEEDEVNRYSAQLYHYVASGAPIKGKDILEVGSGRGGGLSFVNRYFKPNRAVGLDLNKTAVDFCNDFYRDEGLSFLKGNAEQLPFEDESFDFVLNVESSHRYQRMDKFLDEVYRVLRPGGYLLFTDFRDSNDLDELNKQIESTPFVKSRVEVITKEVLEALNLASDSRVNLVKKMTPQFLHKLGNNFAATKGTPTYNKFSSNEFEYIYKVLKKENRKAKIESQV